MSKKFLRAYLKKLVVQNLEMIGKQYNRIEDETNITTARYKKTQRLTKCTFWGYFSNNILKKFKGIEILTNFTKFTKIIRPFNTVLNENRKLCKKKLSQSLNFGQNACNWQPKLMHARKNTTYTIRKKLSPPKKLPVPFEKMKLKCIIDETLSKAKL